MPSIRILPPETVNRIAAGEVVERPASIVKELVENAIDADATEIEIDVEDGGRQRVTVRDNGRGMDPDDLRLAFRSHATSKLREEDFAGGLFGIATLGFRGEALASIAAVAEVEAISRPPRSEHASRYVPARDELRPAAAPPGTVIEVRNLFFNVPARRKFLKSGPAEISRIVQQVTCLALGFPGVHFRLTSRGRTNLDFPAAGGLRERVLQVVGPEHERELVTVIEGEENGPLVLRGFVGLPSWRRSNAQHQHFFVNSRWVKDRSLSHALRSAYQGLLVPGLQPIGYLFLDFAPEKVDVNVHPTKTEVRFRDAQEVYRAVLGGVRRALDGARGKSGSISPDSGRVESEAPDLPLVLSEGAAEGGSGFRSGDLLSPAALDRRRVERAAKDYLESAANRDERGGFGLRRPRDRSSKLPGSERDAGAASARTGSSPPALPRSRPVRSAAIQVLESYLLIEEPDGLVLIDQHALHEKILFEDIVRRLGEGTLLRQKLLVPEIVSLPPEHAPLIDEAIPTLGACGYAVEPFGDRDIAVHAVPELFSRVRSGGGAADFIREFFRALAEGEIGASGDAPADPEALLSGPFRRLASLLACKRAVKAGTRLAPDEIQSLLARAELADDPEHCPHGRPTAVRVPAGEIARRFDRR